MNLPQPSKINVAAIDNVNTLGFDGDLRCGFDIVYLTVGDGKKCRDVPAQVNHGVKLYG